MAEWISPGRPRTNHWSPTLLTGHLLDRWTGIAEFAGLEFAGLENDGLENDGLENDGLDVSKQQTRLNVLSYGIKNLDRSFFRFVTIHAFDGQTDGQTDSFFIARPRLHLLQRQSQHRVCLLGVSSKKWSPFRPLAFKFRKVCITKAIFAQNTYKSCSKRHQNL